MLGSSFLSFQSIVFNISVIREHGWLPIPPTTPQNSFLVIPFWRSRDLFRSGLYTNLLVRFGFFSQGKSNFGIVKLHNITF